MTLAAAKARGLAVPQRSKTSGKWYASCPTCPSHLASDFVDTKGEASIRARAHNIVWHNTEPAMKGT